MLRRSPRNQRSTETGAAPPPAPVPDLPWAPLPYLLQSGFQIGFRDARGLMSCENRPRSQRTMTQAHPNAQLGPADWDQHGIEDSDCRSQSLDPNDPPKLANPLRQAIYINDRDNPSDRLPPNVLNDIADLPLRLQLIFAANFAELAIRRRMCIIHNRDASSNADGSVTRGAGMNGLISAIRQINGEPYPPPVDKVGDGYSELMPMLLVANAYTISSIGDVDRVANQRSSGLFLDLNVMIPLNLAISLYERDSPYDEFSDRAADEFSSLSDDACLVLACLYTELAVRRRLCMGYNRGRDTSMILNTPTFHNEVLHREASGALPDILRNEALPLPGMAGLRDALEQATEVYVANATQHPWHELKDLICLAQKYTYHVIGEEPRDDYYLGRPRVVFGQYIGEFL